ncbi:MBL fold metallo-hydrolase [Citricoccus sp. NR2]|uniref:MBL fold metallo-hydrolase n=1 Tax=Citricoccus sp. NR2 TaxID=3004095 RepID=UPI0022DD7117|nr:MBL fold metallo-hydrolase [Citricoccus sp. NR2]WBL20358.1 MBL fold metallo-hydrolase [Citricoccus sp. NR2]
MSLTEQITPLVTAITAANSSGMTLQGTTTYLVADPESDTVVLVDPGPRQGAEAHADAVEEALDGRAVELILVTHRHEDHTGAVDVFARRFAAPVRAGDRTWCREAEPLIPNLVLEVAGTVISVVHTPGHTSDSYCFWLPEDDGERGRHEHEDGDGPEADAAEASMLTGDTILGEGTTMLDHPDGTLADYLASLELLRLIGEDIPTRVLPAHGPLRWDLASAAQEYVEHREARLDQIRSMVAEQRQDATALARALAVADQDGATGTALEGMESADAMDVVETLMARIYPQLPEVVRGPARRTLAAHLRYLGEAAGSDVGDAGDGSSPR